MLITQKHKETVEKFVKKGYGDKHSFIELTFVAGAHWNCLNEAIPMCTNNIIMLLTFNTETYFGIYTKQVSCPLALPLYTS